jgi:hypothetical protein
MGIRHPHKLTNESAMHLAVLSFHPPCRGVSFPQCLNEVLFFTVPIIDVETFKQRASSTRKG